MNALEEVVQRPRFDWPVRDTGARAYGPISERVVTGQPVHHSPFEDIDSRVAEPIAKQHAVLDEIREFFVFRDHHAVAQFLRDHRTIPQILLDVLPQLKKSFASETVFALKVLTEEDGSRELYVVVVWPGKARDVTRAMDSFIEDWWIERLAPAAGRLHFTYELE